MAAWPAQRSPSLASLYQKIYREEAETGNLWSALLAEVAASRGSSLPARWLLVLGDRESGKTTLLAKLQGNEDPKKGSGLEFGYIEVRDDESEEAVLLSHAVLDGDPAHANLLQFALTAENYRQTTVVVCASMARPWAVLDQLTKWLTILQDHVDQLELSADQVHQFRQETLTGWESYTEPGPDFSAGFRSLGSPGAEEQFPLTDLSPVAGGGDELPGTATLARNLGLDLVVVLTKTDSMPSLEAEHGFTDQHFDFIQQAVRRFCLTYGASLFYTSVKEDKNCDLLYKYLVHRNYQFPFSTPALVVERDAVFIPAGWDSPAKISILLENLFRFRPDQPYNEVIRSPFAGQPGREGRQVREAEVVAEQEQDFLARIAPFLQQESHQERPLSSRLLHSPESVLKTPERRVVGSPGVHSALKRSEFGPGKNPNDGAISNFFHALLNKKTGTGAGGNPAPPALHKEAQLAEQAGRTQITNLVEAESVKLHAESQS